MVNLSIVTASTLTPGSAPLPAAAGSGDFALALAGIGADVASIVGVPANDPGSVSPLPPPAGPAPTDRPEYAATGNDLPVELLAAMPIAGAASPTPADQPDDDVEAAATPVLPDDQPEATPAAAEPATASAPVPPPAAAEPISKAGRTDPAQGTSSSDTGEEVPPPSISPMLTRLASRQARLASRPLPLTPLPARFANALVPPSKGQGVANASHSAEQEQPDASAADAAPVASPSAAVVLPATRQPATPSAAIPDVPSPIADDSRGDTPSGDKPTSTADDDRDSGTQDGTGAVATTDASAPPPHPDIPVVALAVTLPPVPQPVIATDPDRTAPAIATTSMAPTPPVSTPLPFADSGVAPIAPSPSPMPRPVAAGADLPAGVTSPQGNGRERPATPIEADAVRQPLVAHAAQPAAADSVATLASALRASLTPPAHASLPASAVTMSPAPIPSAPAAEVLPLNSGSMPSPLAAPVIVKAAEGVAARPVLAAPAANGTAAASFPVVGAVLPAGRAFAALIAGAVATPRRALRDDDTVMPSIALGAAPTPLAAAAATIADTASGNVDPRQGKWADAIIDRIEMLRDAANATDTRIRLAPDTLGTVDVAIQRSGDTIDVRFTADRAETRQLLTDAQPQLTEIAAQRGIRIGQTSIDAGQTGQGSGDGGASGRSASPGGSNAGSNQPQRQPDAPRQPIANRNPLSTTPDETEDPAALRGWIA